jgi:hypothetical protein
MAQNLEDLMSKEIFGEELWAKLEPIVKEKGLNLILDNKEKPDHIPKSRFDEVIGSKNELKTQVTELSSQLETLKKSAKGNEELTKQIEDLQRKNGDWEGKYKETLLTGAIKVEALKVKAKDPADVIAFLDKAKLEIAEDGTIKGLDEQLKKLQESKPYLFGESATPPAGGGANPPGSGNKTEIQQVEEQLAEAQKKGNFSKVVSLRDKLFELNKK